MSDRDIIIRLATEVMGWNIRAVALTSGIFDATDGSTHCWPKWNPLESWADVMELQGKLSGCDTHAYARELCVLTDAFMEAEGSINLHKRDWRLSSATPRQRCEAMIAVLGKP